MLIATCSPTSKVHGAYLADNDTPLSPAIVNPLEPTQADVKWNLGPFSDRTDGYLHCAAVFLPARRDAFGQTRVVDPSGASGNFAANHIEGRIRHWLIKDNVRLDIGSGLLLGGKFLERAPNAAADTDTKYLFTDIEVTF